jgi:siroheme synthase-like protein
MSGPHLLPLFVRLERRRVLLVGGGRMATERATQLVAAGADVTVVAPDIRPAVAQLPVRIRQRPFEPDDVENVFFVIAAAPSTVNAAVAAAAEARHVLVNAVDDLPNATAYFAGVVRRGDVTFAVSTEGRAPALTALLRQALEVVLPDDFEHWTGLAERLRREWRRDNVAMDARRPLLLRALNRLYCEATE